MFSVHKKHLPLLQIQTLLNNFLVHHIDEIARYPLPKSGCLETNPYLHIRLKIP